MVYVFGRGPGATHQTGHKAVWIAYDSTDAAVADASVASHQEMWVGLYEDIEMQYIDVSLLRFDLSAIAAEASVTEAVLRVVLANIGGPRMFPVNIQVMQLSVAWGVDDTNQGVSEDPASGGQATWNNAKSQAIPVPWCGMGGGFSGFPPPYEIAPVGLITVPTDAIQGTAFNVDLTTVVQAWHIGNNQGIALMQPVPTGSWDDDLGFGSQLHDIELLRPSLTVTTDEAGPSSDLWCGVWSRSKFVQRRV